MGETCVNLHCTDFENKPETKSLTPNGLDMHANMYIKGKHAWIWHVFKRQISVFVRCAQGIIRKKTAEIYKKARETRRPKRIREFKIYDAAVQRRALETKKFAKQNKNYE